MATDNESFNRDLYDLLKVRGYDPVPLDSKNQRVPASQAADVIQFTFNKAGEDYGKVWVTIDDAKNVIVYYDEEQQESPSNITPGVEYNDSWTGFLTHLKNWSQRRQLSFELSNKDRLSDDMRQRDYYKMKERVSEGYYPMGKKASYNDAVPNVKIILQHNRALEEGEQRYRNVAKIFLENQEGERFLAPTTRPGIARVYARHIAEGGVPNDERWNHVKSICEDYNKMAGFVRATRNNQFNESAQELVNEGVNHYNNLRETLSKLAGHRGYQAYFESWTPTLMEDENDDVSINELFVQETVDPRIESAMPILSRLKKPVTEMSEVDTLAEWADSIISEKLDLEEGEDVNETSDQYKIDYLKKTSGGEPHPNPIKRMMGKKYPRSVPDLADKGKAAFTKKIVSNISGKKWDDEQQADLEKTLVKHSQRNKNMVKVAGRMGYDIDENFINMAPQAVAEEEVDENYFTGLRSSLSSHGGRDLGTQAAARRAEQKIQSGHYGDKSSAPAPAKPSGKDEEVEEGLGDAVKKGMKSLKRGMQGWEKGMHDVEIVKRNTANLTPDMKDAIAKKKVGGVFGGMNTIPKGSPAEFQYKLIKREKNKEVDEATGYYDKKHPQHDRMTKDGYEHSEDDIQGKKMHRYYKPGESLTDLYKYDDEDVKEDLDANQKRAGQLGPTEKVKNNNIGKLVGANESTEIDPELARIMEMARFKR